MNATDLINVLKKVRVVPVITPKSQESCLEAVKALVEGGASVIEITLRSEIAYATLPILRTTYPDIIFGAGTVMDPKTYDKAVELGADFTISPGRCEALEAYTKGRQAVHIPGCFTPTEMIAARKAGQKILKFFPSEAAGGVAVLKDLGTIFPDIVMMPSGGIKEEMLPAYAALSCVLSVGGSWMYADNGQYRTAVEISQVMNQSIKAMCD